MNFDAAFWLCLAKRIEQIEAADFVVGIPCYNNEATIVNVLKQVGCGLAKHFHATNGTALSLIMSPIISLACFMANGCVRPSAAISTCRDKSFILLTFRSMAGSRFSTR